MSLQNRTKLAALFSQLSFFIPERNGENQWTGRFLVNQSKVYKRKKEIEKMKLREKADMPATECPPERDDLLHLIGEASLELKSFIDEHDEAMKQIQSFMSDSMIISDELKSAIGGMPPDMPTLEKLQIVVDRYRQMIQLLHTIAHDIPTDEIKGRVARFLEWKGNAFQMIKPDLNALIRQVEDGTGTIAMEYPEYRNAVLKLCEIIKPLVNQNTNGQETTQSNAGGGKPVLGQTCEVCGGPHASFKCPGPQPAAAGKSIPPQEESKG